MIVKGGTVLGIIAKEKREPCDEEADAEFVT